MISTQKLKLHIPNNKSNAHFRLFQPPPQLKTAMFRPRSARSTCRPTLSRGARLRGAPPGGAPRRGRRRCTSSTCAAEGRTCSTMDPRSRSRSSLGTTKVRPSRGRHRWMYPNKFLFKKIHTPKFFSALPTPNQRKTCIKHLLLTKKMMQKPTYPIFFRPLQETNNIFLLALAMGIKS